MVLGEAMKVALILSGHMRGYKHTFNDFNKHLLSKYDVDTYISTWDIYGWWSASSNLDKSLDMIDIDEVRNYYNPIALNVETYHNFDERFSNEAKTPLYHNALKNQEIRIQNTLSMYYKIQDSIKLFKNTNKDYDIVIRTRPDLVMDRDYVSISQSVKIDGGYGFGGRGIGDLFYMGMPIQIEALSDVYDSIPNIIKETQYFCPHVILEQHLKNKQIAYERINTFNIFNGKSGQWSN